MTSDAQRTMLDTQLRRRGLTDSAVLRAMERIPRAAFVPEALAEQAYADRALGIGCGQTISQPYIVAYMTAQLGLHPEHRVLEIGTGSGYQTAILAALAGHVYTVERCAALSAGARPRIAALQLTNITYRVGDGTAGWPEHAPFDRILVAAAAPRVPVPLVQQLAVGGRMILPVGAPRVQRLVVVARDGGGTRETPLIGCRFVNLLGQWGWPDPPPSSASRRA